MSRDYFFADYCAGWIRRLERVDGPSRRSRPASASPVDLKVSDDGACTTWRAAPARVYRVDLSAQPARRRITTQPASRTVAAGASATFSVRASGTPPLRISGSATASNIAGRHRRRTTRSRRSPRPTTARASAPSSPTPSATSLSNEAALTVTSNQAPTGTITQPAAGTLVQRRAWSSTTPARRPIPRTARCRPARSPGRSISITTRTCIRSSRRPPGRRSGSFTIPTTGETAANVWYRIYLTVRDSGGLTHTTQRDILPRKVAADAGHEPGGLQVRLDGQPVATPIYVRQRRRHRAHARGGDAADVRRRRPTRSCRGPTAAPARTPSRRRRRTRPTRRRSPRTAARATGSRRPTSTTPTSPARRSRASTRPWTSTGAPASPAPGIGADTFSVRWTGQVQPQFTQTYTFYTRATTACACGSTAQLIVNNWTDHAPTENSGTIALTAGQRYDDHDGVLRERRRRRREAARGAAPSTPKAVVPSARFPECDAAAVDDPRQLPASWPPVPAGYLKDGGRSYGSRGNGQTYGWNADNTETRDRNAANSPDQRYDTLAYMQRPANPNAVWEIAVPNGTYVVHAVAGDAAYFDIIYRIAVEGVLTVSGTPTARRAGSRARNGHGDGRPDHDSQRRGRDGEQDLLRRYHAAIADDRRSRCSACAGGRKACRVQADAGRCTVQADGSTSCTLHLCTCSDDGAYRARVFRSGPAIP